MLNSRQKNIIEELEKHSPTYLTADHFVNKFEVSMRTVQSDIRTIREFLAQQGFAELVSVASKGSKLVIKDYTLYKSEMFQDKESLSGKSDRQNQEALHTAAEPKKASKPPVLNRQIVYIHLNVSFGFERGGSYTQELSTSDTT